MQDELSSSSGRTSSGRRPATDGTPEVAELLRGNDPVKILERLVRDDALGIRPHTLDRLAERGFLLDPERLLARVFARVAHDADLYEEEPFPPWLEERIDRSMRELVREDWEEERRGELPDPDDVRYQFLTELLGLEPGLCRRAAIAVNDLDDTTRIAFTAVTMRGQTLQQCIDAGLGTLEEVRDAIRTAILAISQIADDDEEGDVL